MTTASSPTRPHERAVLTHERLDVYRLARDFLGLVQPLVRRLPRIKGQLGDQLQRAREGILLRIAEGAGAETRSAEQRRYFRSARGSALECAAALDVCRIRGIGSGEMLAEGRALLVRLVQMLTVLARER